jgi:hypothetical protein
MARLLLLFGAAFLAANLLGVAEQVRYWRRRRAALLTWPAKRPALFQMQVGIGVVLGVLFVFNLLLRPGAVEQTFGVGMMFVYYAGVVPLSARIERGFYRDGAWGDRRFIRYARVAALAWREEPGADPVLLLALRNGRSAVRLSVPGPQFGAVRRLLRDLIGGRVLHLEDAGLHLGLKDEREDA